MTFTLQKLSTKLSDELLISFYIDKKKKFYEIDDFFPFQIHYGIQHISLHSFAYFRKYI